MGLTCICPARGAFCGNVTEHQPNRGRNLQRAGAKIASGDEAARDLTKAEMVPEEMTPTISRHWQT